MTFTLSLFLIGVLGFILNRKNIILLIISLEIMLLAVTLLFLISSYSFDDSIGQTFGIYVIAIAGAESVIGLSILIAYYRLKGSISLANNAEQPTRKPIILDSSSKNSWIEGFSSSPDKENRDDQGKSFQETKRSNAISLAK